MSHEQETAEEGFTLVELLVAMSLLAILSGLFVNTIVLSKKMAGVSDRLLSSRELYSVENYLRRDLKQAFKVFRLDRQARALRLEFRGTSDRLELVLPANVDVEYGGLRYVSFLTDANADAGARFITRRRPVRATVQSSRPVKTSEVVLLEEISKISFRYFGSQPDNGRHKSGWFDTWDSVAQIPQLVELNIVQLVEGRRVARKIVIDLPLAR